MIRRSRNPERLAALFGLGVILFLPPFLLLFNLQMRVLGIPLLYLYLFTAWLGLIALAAFASKRLDTIAEGAGTERAVSVFTDLDDGSAKRDA
jgi:hypothetical protein